MVSEKCGTSAERPDRQVIEQPQTNGVAERVLRTLKEQIIHGRIYRTVAELRAAVEAFVDLYNEQWLPEKNGFMSPLSDPGVVVR
jgi:transposase InsO family protein